MVECLNISKRIKEDEVLTNINYKFEKGKVYLVTGHNGSGKTMLLRMLCGLLTPTKGEIRKPAGISYGVIIEKPAFWERETAMYNLRYLASIKKQINTDEINAALHSVNLADKANIKVKKFSLGMKQRLALAQALMEDPDMLLLDEPFNALDDENYERVIQLLMKEKEKKKTIIIAAHGEIKSKEILIDEELKLSNGKLVS